MKLKLKLKSSDGKRTKGRREKGKREEEEAGKGRQREGMMDNAGDWRKPSEAVTWSFSHFGLKEMFACYQLVLNLL